MIGLLALVVLLAGMDRAVGDDGSQPEALLAGVVADEAGKPLIKSNARNPAGEDSPTNIGVPSSKRGIEHFMTMFKQTAPGMSDETLAGLRKQLEKKP